MTEKPPISTQGSSAASAAPITAARSSVGGGSTVRSPWEVAIADRRRVEGDGLLGKPLAAAQGEGELPFLCSSGLLDRLPAASRRGLKEAALRCASLRGTHCNQYSRSPRWS